jgi:hypothetical protein
MYEFFFNLGVLSPESQENMWNFEQNFYRFSRLCENNEIQMR